jgi:hypothetical protein
MIRSTFWVTSLIGLFCVVSLCRGEKIIYSNIATTTSYGFFRNASDIFVWDDLHLNGGGLLEALTLVAGNSRPSRPPGSLIEVEFRRFDNPNGGPVGTLLGAVTIDLTGSMYSTGNTLVNADALESFNVVLPSDEWIAIGVHFNDPTKSMGVLTFDPPTVGESSDAHWVGSDPAPRFCEGIVGRPVPCNFGWELRTTRADRGPSNVVVLGNSGWQVSWDSSLDPFVDIAVDAVTENAVFIERTAEFIQGKGLAGFPTIPITFTQIEADAVERIVINDEVITNSTGSNWTGFRYQLLDGNDVAFNPDMSNASAGGSGFSTSPLDNQMFGPANKTFSVDGFGLSPGGGNAVVADGTQWFPGDGARDGELYIDVVTGDGSLEGPFTVFTLKGTPSFVPEPTTACLLALAGLILLASSVHGVRSRLPMVGRCSLGHPDDLEV